MRRSRRNPLTGLLISSCCTRDYVDESMPATPRPGQSTRMTPRTEIGLRGQLRGPVARLPPGIQVGDGGSRRQSRALTQRGVSDATLVASSQPSDMELNNMQRSAEHIAPTEQQDPGPPSLILPLQNPPTQGNQQESPAPRPEAHRAQDETRQRHRRSLYVESSPRLHDTRQQHRRSLAMDNIPAQEFRLESPATGPEDQSASHETRRQRRRSSRIDNSRHLESPVTGPEDRSTSRETRQRRRRSLQTDSSPRRPDSRQYRRQSQLQNPPQVSQPEEDSDPGRLAHPPLGVEQLSPASPSPDKPKADEGGAGNTENGNGDVKRGESSKDGAGGDGKGGSA